MARTPIGPPACLRDGQHGGGLVQLPPELVHLRAQIRKGAALTLHLVATANDALQQLLSARGLARQRALREKPSGHGPGALRTWRPPEEVRDKAPTDTRCRPPLLGRRPGPPSGAPPGTHRPAASLSSGSPESGPERPPPAAADSAER
jgi:hypothetical protein